MSADGIFLAAHGAQLRTERLDVGIDGAVERGLGLFPGLLHELVAREDAARLLHEYLQQAELVARECEGRAVVADFATLFIHRKNGGLCRIGLGLGSATENGLHPRGKLARAEW